MMYLNVSDFDHRDTLLPEFGHKKSPLITEEQRDIMIVVGGVFISTAICLFGTVSNIINVIVFYKQGFKNTVNISFLGLALSDFAVVLTLLWLCVCVNPLFHNSDIPFDAFEIENLTTGVPHVLFSRITCFITAFVTVERCLGVILPLKVKRIITPRVTIIVLILMYVVNILSIVPEFIVMPLTWKFYEHKNKTLLGTVYLVGHPLARMAYIVSPLLSTASFLVVVIFTAVLVIQLKQKSKWRSSVTHNEKQATEVSTRDKGTMRIVIVIASVLIVCNIPGYMIIAAMIVEPEFAMHGAYVRIWLGVWTYAMMCQAISSSVNIFFYYTMSTNYRMSLQQLLRSCKRGQGRV